MRDRLPFSTVKASHSRNTVFEERVYYPRDRRLILAEFQANGEKSSPEASDASEEIVHDKGYESAEMYPVLGGVRSQNNSGWYQVMRLVSIPGVEKLFESCESLSRVVL